VAVDQKVYHWSLWVSREDYRSVYVVQCPNLPGTIFEHKDLEYCKSQVVNKVAGYINDCKNLKIDVVLTPDDQLPQPPEWFETIHMKSM
jgi:hypothetical protein